MKKLIGLMIMMIISFSSFSQEKNTTLQPLLLKDSTGITLYAFNKQQVKVLAKAIEINDILEDRVFLLENRIVILEEKVNTKDSVNQYLENRLGFYYRISAVKDSINENNTHIITEYVSVKDGLETKIKKKNRTIITLLGTNAITVLLIVLILI